MGWHDALAAKMAESGRSSAEFRAGARRKARDTVLLLVAAGAVGYVAGWAWALLPAAVALWPAFQSVSATRIATRLEVIEARSQPGPAS